MQIVTRSPLPMPSATKALAVSSMRRRRDGKRLSTVNARREGMAKSWTYGGPWRKGQRCIIPAQLYVEPYWGTGKHIPWQFERTDGEPWGLAGLWGEWTDPVTGEVPPSYTMILGGSHVT